LRTRSFFLTLACRDCQLHKDGTRVPTRQPRGLAAPGGCGSLLESLAGSRGPHGPGGCLSAPAFGDFGPGPRFGIRHSPAVPHEQDRRGTPYSPVRPSQRTTLLRHARRRSGAKASWISTPNGLRSRRRPRPRQVLDPNAPSGQRREHDGTAQEGGDKSDRGKSRKTRRPTCA